MGPEEIIFSWPTAETNRSKSVLDKIEDDKLNVLDC